MQKEVKIILAEKLEKEYIELNKIVSKEKKESIDSSFHQTLLRAINKNKDLLKINPFYGDPLKKKLIPRQLMQKYDIDNLWRIELPGYWRMLYSLTGNEVRIICFVLEICNHERYNKLFGYKRK